MDKQPPLGSGERFEALATKVAKEPGVRDPKAVAAAAGRKSLGASKFNKLAQAGKAREKMKRMHGGK